MKTFLMSDFVALNRFESYLDCGAAQCREKDYKEHFHCTACSMQVKYHEYSLGGLNAHITWQRNQWYICNISLYIRTTHTTWWHHNRLSIRVVIDILSSSVTDKLRSSSCHVTWEGQSRDYIDSLMQGATWLLRQWSCNKPSVPSIHSAVISE